VEITELSKTKKFIALREITELTVGIFELRG